MKAPTSEQVSAALGHGLKGAAAGMVLGPVGAVVGGLAALISDLVPGLVLNPDTKPAVSDAAAFITASPTEAGQVEALKQDPAAAEQFKAQVVEIAAAEQKRRDDRDDHIRQMLVEQGKTDAADTANARQMGVQLAQSGSKVQWAPVVLSAIILVSFGVLIFVVLTHDSLSDKTAPLANVLLGSLAAMATQVGNYWLGSSSGSAAKTEWLARSVPASLLPNPAAVVPAADVTTSKS